MMEFLVEEWCRIIPKEIQTLVESMEGALTMFWQLMVAQRPTKTRYVGASFVLAVTCRFKWVQNNN
jgi:hypothetical protein